MHRPAVRCASGGTFVLALLTSACAPQPVDTPMPPHVQPVGELPPAGVTAGMLTYTITAAPASDAPDVVQGRLIATNTSGGPLHTELPGGCMMWLQAYREGAWTRPAWDWRRLGDACTMDLVILHLAAGESSRHDRWNYRLRHADILGDSLPEGEYRIGARIYPIAQQPNGYVVVAETPVRLTRRP